MTTDIAHMLGQMDPWYERNVLSLLSLSSDVLCEVLFALVALAFCDMQSNSRGAEKKCNKM